MLPCGSDEVVAKHFIFNSPYPSCLNRSLLLPSTPTPTVTLHFSPKSAAHTNLIRIFPPHTVVNFKPHSAHELGWYAAGEDKQGSQSLCGLFRIIEHYKGNWKCRNSCFWVLLTRSDDFALVVNKFLFPDEVRILMKYFQRNKRQTVKHWVRSNFQSSVLFTIRFCKWATTCKRQ